MLENAIRFASLHSIDKHPRQSKGNSFWIYPSHFINLETISKVNMDHFPCISLYHYVERMPISQSYDVAHYRHNRQTSDEA